MKLLSQVESKLGLTRADSTVALFLAATALVGFVYTTYVSRPADVQQQRELFELVARHDSIIAEEHARRRAQLQRSIAAADSVSSGTAVTSEPLDDTVRQWVPLDSSDLELDRIELAARETPVAQPPRELKKPLNINTASQRELELLPGVGPKTAERIIAHRRRERFASVEEIMRVRGIGQKKFEKMRRWLRVE